jgi:hypothetical protein
VVGKGHRIAAVGMEKGCGSCLEEEAPHVVVSPTAPVLAATAAAPALSAAALALAPAGRVASPALAIAIAALLIGRCCIAHRRMGVRKARGSEEGVGEDG